MERVIVGPSLEKTFRFLLITALFVFFAVAFLLDGYYGYPTNNTRQLYRTLGLDTQSLPEVNQNLTAQRAEQLIHQFTEEGYTPNFADSMGLPELKHENQHYFLGPGGYLRATWEAERCILLEWFVGVHSETDLSIQKTTGWVVSVASLIAIALLVQMLSKRAKLDDSGLQLPGQGMIFFEDMQSVSSSADDKSWVNLNATQNHQPLELTLYRYDYGKLEALVDAICTRCGFDNPFQAPVEDEEPESGSQ